MLPVFMFAKVGFWNHFSGRCQTKHHYVPCVLPCRPEIAVSSVKPIQDTQNTKAVVKSERSINQSLYT